MRTLFTQTATTTLANSAAATTLVGTGIGSMTIPKNFLKVGKSLRLRWAGKIASLLTPTLKLDFQVGGVSFAATAVLTLPALTGTKIISGEVLMTCITAGGAGTAFTQGMGSIDNAAVAIAQGMLNSTTNALDTTAALAVGLIGTWGTANAANTVTLTNVILELLN